MKISVIIPTWNAGRYLADLIDILNRQTTPPDEIIVIDSESEDNTQMIAESHKNVIFISIHRKDFDHGGTRRLAFEKSTGDFVLFLTQDALPTNEHYIKNLLEPFQNPSVAMTSGRQKAKPDASRIEQLTRIFNYPEESNFRSKDDIPRLGIKTFFASDVCAAYRRTAYFEVGGFDCPILTNEDMLIAAHFIDKNYKIAYCADAEVFHSHNFSLRQIFRRNYNIGVFMKTYASFFADVPVVAEGGKMIKFVFSELLKKGQTRLIILFGMECAVKLTAYQLGYHSVGKFK
jgi:rhamnosyltransferase